MLSPTNSARRWIPGKGWDDGPDIYSKAKYTKNQRRFARGNEFSSVEGDLMQPTLANDGQHVPIDNLGEV